MAPTESEENMESLHSKLTEILKTNKRFVSEDGHLLKNLLQELSSSSDPELLTLLASYPMVFEAFFTKTEAFTVFNQWKFNAFVSSKSWLPDSFTAYKNKVGLGVGTSLLGESKPIVLAWPFKDCVLEGEMTKEDEPRSEIFHSEVLAPDQIANLLAPKAFCNFELIQGEATSIPEQIETEADGTLKSGLLVKGNNLLALASLRSKYRGKVKLIYIDPPYNIGGDSFRYNDRFNHASWLTYMKNRLEIARDLLAEEGAIFVQIDHHEVAYLSVLMDEIFNRDNKVQIISVKTASPAGFKTVNPGPIDVTEYILFYTKNSKSFQFKKSYVEVSYDKNYNLYINRKGSDDPKTWVFERVKAKAISDAGFATEAEVTKQFGAASKAFVNEAIAAFAFANAENVVSVRDPHKPTEKIRELMAKSKANPNVVLVNKRNDGSEMYLYKGGALAFYSSKLRDIDGKRVVTELLTDFWGHISWAGTANEGGVKLKNGKKPEKLLKQIIEMTTEPNDIVLDFFAGSGTTAAVAHKMGRRFITVEQMDYIEEITKQRLRNVVAGDKSGVSEAVKWQGGGSILYCELALNNASQVERIENAKTDSELIQIFEDFENSPFLSYKIDPKKLSESIKDFSDMTLEDKKAFLFESLDKNSLYVNLSDIDDPGSGVKPQDVMLTEAFYGAN